MIFKCFYKPASQQQDHIVENEEAFPGSVHTDQEYCFNGFISVSDRSLFRNMMLGVGLIFLLIFAGFKLAIAIQSISENYSTLLIVFSVFCGTLVLGRLMRTENKYRVIVTIRNNDISLQLDRIEIACGPKHVKANYNFCNGERIYVAKTRPHSLDEVARECLVFDYPPSLLFINGKIKNGSFAWKKITIFPISVEDLQIAQKIIANMGPEQVRCLHKDNANEAPSLLINEKTNHQKRNPYEVQGKTDRLYTEREN